MGRVIVGAAAAAAVMFVLGFLFFATPLGSIAVSSLDDGQAANVQAALAQNVPDTGTYAVPSPESREQTSMYAQGPIATIHYNSAGFGAGNTSDMLAGFIHMYVSALLIGFAVLVISRHVREFSTRATIIVFFALGAGVFMRLGAPIWMHHGWGFYIYAFITDVISLSVAGMIIARWFLPRDWDDGRERVGAEAE